MKLLLTSAGIRNKSIAKALRELVSKDFTKLNLALIPTAMNVESGDKGWIINDLVNCKKLKFASIDIVDISALPRKIWESRLRSADVLLFGGGNTLHLMHWIKKVELDKILPELLENRVYVGISAGSIIASKELTLSSSEDLYGDERNEEGGVNGLGYINFYVRPHFNSSHFPKLTSENIKKLAEAIDEPVYALDDESAIKVVDDQIDIISEGKWEKF